jgi:protocatechuate 3,4-dioxygenase beta subunit
VDKQEYLTIFKNENLMKALLLIFCFMSLNIFSFAQDITAQLKPIEEKLSSGRATVTQILTDISYMQLHSKTDFRELIKRFAKQGRITLITAAEPGTRITVKGKIADNNDKPLGNALVYIYHTDNKGWYSDTAGHISGMEGDRKHARLFGYFKTNNDGTFEFYTIHPQGYPNSNLPQHIHFEVFSNTGQALIITELLFNEDPRLTSSIRERMSNEGAIISSNACTKNAPLYNYEIKVN